jgi:hypothetical protein
MHPQDSRFLQAIGRNGYHSTVFSVESNAKIDVGEKEVGNKCSLMTLSRLFLIYIYIYVYTYIDYTEI